MSILEGIIEIVLDGVTVELRPTPLAALKLSQTFGGLFGIIQRVRQLDFEAMAAVVHYGAGLKPKECSDLSDKIYRSGLTTIAPALMDYITVLANGGKLPNLDDQAEEAPAGKD